MTLDAHIYVFAYILWPIAFSVSLFSLPLVGFYRWTQPKAPGEASIFIVVFGLLGAVSGICVGTSRDPVVSASLPAILTLITVFGGFAFTSQGLAKIRPVIPFCLIGMLLLSVYWIFVGSKIRFDYESYTIKVWQNLMRFEKVDLELEKAQRFKLAGIPLPKSDGSKESSNESGLVEPSKPIAPPNFLLPQIPK
jgi:hypothetical protein